MHGQITQYAYVMMTAGVLALGLAAEAWRRRPVRGARTFAAVMLAAAEWSLAYAAELASPTFSGKLFWARVQYLGIAAMPPLWFAFALRYTTAGVGKLGRGLRSLLVFLACGAAATVALAWTNDSHGWLWRRVELVPVGLSQTMRFTGGPWYWANVAVSHCVVLVSILLLIRGRARDVSWIRRVAAPIASVVLPWAGNLVYVLRTRSVAPLDWTPLGFVLGGAMMAFGLLPTGIVRRRIWLRDAIVENMSDAVILADLRGHTIDMNNSAIRLFALPAAEVVGCALEGLVPGVDRVLGCARAAGESRAMLKVASGGRKVLLDDSSADGGADDRYYDIVVSGVPGTRRRPPCYLLLLLEVTKRVWAERVLRDSRGELERMVAEKTTELSALSALALRCARLSLGEDAAEVLVRELRPLAGALVVGLSLYDKATSSLVVARIAADGWVLESAVAHFGHAVIGMRIPVPPETLAEMHREVVRDFDDAGEPFLGVVRPAVARALAALIGAGRCTALALIDGGELLGTAAIVMPRGAPPLRPEISRAVANVVAVALRKRQTEAALRDSERQLRTLFQQAPIGIYRTDLDGRIVMANAALVRMLGYSSADELTGRRPARADNAVDEGEATFEQRVRSVGSVSGWESRWTTRGGSAIFVRENARLVHDDDGTPLFFDGTAEDITERRKAEALLRALDEAARAMESALVPDEIHSAVVAVLKPLGFSCVILRCDRPRQSLSVVCSSLDSDGGGPGHGPAGERLAGPRAVERLAGVIERSETVLIIGAGAVDWLPQTDGRGPGPWDGAQTPEPRCIAAPLLVDGKVTGAFVVYASGLAESDRASVTAFSHEVASALRKAQLLQDLRASLDELRRTQDQLIQARKMEAIGRLAGGVAHDFNNLLTVIAGFTEVLAAQVGTEGGAASAVQEIRTAASRAAELTSQLLTFSRRQIMRPRVIDLNEAVRSVQAMFSRIIGADVELRLSLHRGSLTVRVDPERLEQVVVDLLVNARQAIPTGGRISLATVAATGAEASAEWSPRLPDGDYCGLIVGDSGVGMSREVLDHLFEPFFTTRRRADGAGLGLAAVHGIVKQSRGEIRVRSVPGQGSTFAVFLPREAGAPAPADPGMPGGGGQKSGRGRTLLLVDDEDGVRKLLSAYLRQRGYAVLEASRADKAIEICGSYSGNIDMTISDLGLPGMGGYEMSRQLAAGRPAMPVLFISGYDEQSLPDAIRRDVSQMMSKPFTPAALVERIERMLGDAM